MNNNNLLTDSENDVNLEPNNQNSTQRVNNSNNKRSGGNKSATNQINKKERPHRIPLREQKRIFIEQEDGYHYRLVTDKSDRISRFEHAGYEKVPGEALGPYRQINDPSQLGEYATQSVGGGQTGYWMRIRKDWWLEEQNKKEMERIKKTKDVVGGRAILGDKGYVVEDTQSIERL